MEALIESLKQEVECSMCLERFIQPRQLPCLHSFCLACLNKLAHQAIGAQERNIKCPLCQAVVPLPDSGDFNNLPSSFYLSSFCDILGDFEKYQHGSKSVVCGNCDKPTIEASHCSECAIFFCPSCLGAHALLKEKRRHRVVPLKDFKAEDFKAVVKQEQFCHEPGHNDKRLNVYCDDCRVGACEHCIHGQHETHNIQPLAELVEKEKQALVEGVKKINEKANKYKQSIAKIDERKQNIRVYLNGVKRDILEASEQYLSFTQAVERQKQDMLDQLGDIEAQSVQCLNAQKETIESELEQMSYCIKTSEAFMNNFSSQEILQLKETVHERIQHLLHSSAHSEPDMDVRIKFLPNNTLRQAFEESGIGELDCDSVSPLMSKAGGVALTTAYEGLEAVFTIFTKNDRGKISHRPDTKLTVDIRSPTAGCIVLEIQDLKNGTYTVRYFAQHAADDYTVSLRVDEEHIYDSPFDLRVHRRRFLPEFIIGEYGSNPGQFKGPYGVAVSSEDEIAVTDETNYIQIFNVNGKLIRRFGGKGSEPGLFDCPRGIAYDLRGNIVVADENNHRVQVFDREGEFLWEISGVGWDGSEGSKLELPWDVCVDNLNNIVVTDRGRCSVLVFTNDGRPLYSFGDAPGEPLGDKCHCLACNDVYVISDRFNHNIKIYTRTGRTFECVRYIGGEGKENGLLHKNKGIIMDKAGNIVVCDSRNNRCQLFKFDGTFHAKFGYVGCRPGQFDNLTDVAMLSDGRFVICDYRNQRLQVIR